MTDTVPWAVPMSAQVIRPDGGVESAPGSPQPSGPAADEDLLPVPVDKRTWTTYNFSALWVARERTQASGSPRPHMSLRDTRWS
ncbi:hypothetical protein [Streptomyces sp. NPDC001222]|uniref:hypothetical protein n=1 Tax=Streptomyces sp. NPDC001222 TaxID=3364548 RepID=UPI0036C9477D